MVLVAIGLPDNYVISWVLNVGLIHLPAYPDIKYSLILEDWRVTP